MKIDELITAVRSALLALLPERGIAAQVKQSYQPVKTGTPSGLTIFIHEVSKVQHWTQYLDRWNGDSFDHVESTQIESTLQFSVSEGDADTLSSVAYVLQSDRGRALLRASGIGIQRASTVRTLYTIDDSEDHEKDPTLDIVFTHRDEFVSSLPAVVAEEININRV